MISNNDMQHLNKTILCENKNIALIHIFEDDWNILYKQKKLKAFIKILIQNNNIYEINSSDDILVLDHSLFSRAITIPNYYYLTSHGPWLIDKGGFPIYVNGEILFKRIS